MSRIFSVGLMLTLLCTGFVSAAIKTEEVSYKSDDVVMKGFLAYDDAVQEKRPGILVVHEWWGHNEYVRNRARMLAELGYSALAVDMYGDGKNTTHPQDAQKFSGEVMQNMDKGKKRFLAAMELLKAHKTVDPQRIAAIGYCFGGSVVLEMARQGVDLDAVASFHGGLKLQTPATPGKIKAKVLVCHGADDSFIPAEEVATFQKEMKAAGADVTFISYPGSKHSFTNPEADEIAKKAGIPVAYNAEADKKSWEDMKNFLTKVFGK
jgi:dienelactone hydrolase